MTTISTSRPGFLLLLVAVVPVYFLWRRWRPPLSAGRSRLALVLRIALLVLVVASLADVGVSRSPDRRAVIAIVDLSDSVRTSRDDAAQAVRSMIEAKGPDQLFGLVTFGSDAQVEITPTLRPTFEDFQTDPNGNYSDLDGALRLAGNLFPHGYTRQVVLVSDGRQNLGDAGEAVAELRDRSIRVDVMASGDPPGAEAMVVALEAPHEVRANQSFTATARLQATAPTPSSLTMTLEGSPVESRNIELGVGASSATFSLPPLPPGVHRLGASIAPETDSYAENNVAEAVVRVLGPPTVLMLEGAPGEGANVTSALEAAGTLVETRPAEQAPTDALALSRYDSVVIGDAPAAAFPPDALQALATNVRDLGRGLVTIGGSRSYGPGDWAGTPLEEALPVRMELSQPRERPAMAVAFVLESLESPLGNGVALGAVQSVIDQLTPDDEVAVVNMRQQGELVLPLTRAIDKPAIEQQIADTLLGDPPGYGAPLALAFDALGESTASNKHVIILGDGDAEAQRDSYDALFARARAELITVSAVGVDTHVNAFWMDHMAKIALRGGGRFYLSNTASDVPEIVLDASRSVLRGWFEESPFFPRITAAGDLLAGVPLDAFPELGGYVRTEAKAGAEVALSTPKDDPLLAGWQFGLGRSVAWTSDGVGRWTTPFLGSPVSSALFSRMVAWTMPTGGGESLKMEATPQGDGLDVSVNGPEGGGQLELRVVNPDRAAAEHELAPISPGHWRGPVPAAQPGTYILHAVLEKDGTAIARGEAAIAVAYSPEYVALGRDDDGLRRLAGPGEDLLTIPAGLWDRPVPRLAVSSDLFWALLLVAAVLWPLDIASRRLNLPAREMFAALTSLRRHRRRSDPPEDVLPASLAQVRSRLDAHRRVDPTLDQTSPGTPGHVDRSRADARLEERVGEGGRR